MAGMMFSLFAIAQSADKRSVVIGSRTDKPNALLIVNPKDSNQGVLMPQLSSSQRNSMKPSSPSEDGLIVFDTNLQTYYYWSNGGWTRIDANNYKKAQYYSIDPVSFKVMRPNGSVSQNNLAIFETDNTFVTAMRDGQGEEMIAAVNLPHGATIKAMTVYYLDNDSDDIQVRFTRRNASSNSENILSWASTGAEALVKSETFSSFNGMELIDLENYTYRIAVIFDIDAEDVIDEPSQARQRLYGVKIIFEQ